jgi:outer membrane protein OmpA-like peptidoglycan-associated protein
MKVLKLSMKLLKGALLVLFAFSFSFSNAQDSLNTGGKLKSKVKPYKPKTSIAKENFFNENFKSALEDYLLMLVNDPNNVDYNYYIGLCYLQTNIDKVKAVSYLEFVVQQSKHPKDAYYHLGRAYMYADRLDDAIRAFDKAKEAEGDTEVNGPKPSRWIEMCINAKEFRKNPIDCNFENLGSSINSPYPDFDPMVPENESFLIYNTKRPDNLGLETDYDGFKMNDVFRARERKGRFTEGRNAGSSINTEWVEEAVGLSPDGENLVLFIDNFAGYDDIMISKRKGRAFEEPYYPGTNVNSEEVESSGSISADGDWLFFSRIAKGGIGGYNTDIFMSRRLPNGYWGIPIDLGPNINTKYNETHPHISGDGKTLYFSSEGHTNMGGLDVFRSTWNAVTETWSSPDNLGFPINTVGDEYSIYFSNSGRYGYVSALRPEGYGDLDIYRITFNNVDPDYTLMAGYITNMVDTIKAGKPAIPINMYITDDETNELVGIFKANKLTGHYISVLPAGHSYCVYIESELYKPYAEVIDAFDKSSYIPIIEDKDFTLEPDSEAIARRKFAVQLASGKSESTVIAKTEMKDMAKEQSELALMEDIRKLEAEVERLKKMKELGYRTDLLDVNVADLKVGDKMVLSDVFFFDFDISELGKDYYDALERLYNFLVNNPSVTIELSGHTDARGSIEYNLKLSKARAQGVFDYLVKKGIKSKRLVPKGYGKSQPIAANENPDGSDNPEGRRMNRRLEIKILSIKK